MELGKLKKITKLIMSFAVFVSLFSFSNVTAEAASQAKPLTLPAVMESLLQMCGDQI